MYNFNKGMGENSCTFPITKEQIDNLKPCRIVNIKEGNNHGIKIPDDFDIIKSTYEIIDVRFDVGNDNFPYWFMDKYYPFEGDYEFPSEVLSIEGLCESNPKDLANIVRMDSPTDMPKAVLKWLTHPDYNQKVNVKKWTANYVNFLETIPDVEEQISDGVKRALHKTFEVKYFYGLARPEEVWKEITGFEHTENITAYPEGCPSHPTFPAGHSGAAAGGVVPIIKELDKLSPKQLKIVLDTAYSWSMFRSLAAVHFSDDNIAGLIIGGLGKYMRKEVREKYTI